jgi:3-O-methylgallate 3,4-dioxygenase
MAQIVLGLGSSHGPTIRTRPENWSRLGQKDMEDPRFDFESELRNAKPDMPAEVTIEKMRERSAALDRGIAALGTVLNDAAPDVVIMLSNLHGDIPDGHQQIFGVFVGDVLPATSRASIPPTDRELATYLHAELNEEGFDVAACDDFGGASGIGDSYTFLYEVYAPKKTTPMVPFMISRYLPNQTSPKRAYALGRAMRKVLDGWDSNKRVAVMASGGLSHQILDEELDRTVVKALQERDADTLCSIPRERLNRGPGTPEILNWITLSAIMQETPMTLIDYVPCYRSLASTGHGVTFGYWA